MASIKLGFFILPLLFASLVLAHDHGAPQDPNYITDDGNEGCSGMPPAAAPGAAPTPNKDCPNKNKGHGGGGGQAPADGGKGGASPAPSPDGQGKDGANADGKGATPPSPPPDDGKGGKDGANADDKGAPPPAPADGGKGGAPTPNKDCPNKNKGHGGGGGAPPSPPADGGDKGKDGGANAADDAKGKDGGANTADDAKGKDAADDAKGKDGGANVADDAKGKDAADDAKGKDGGANAADGKGDAADDAKGKDGANADGKGKDGAADGKGKDGAADGKGKDGAADGAGKDGANADGKGKDGAADGAGKGADGKGKKECPWNKRGGDKGKGGEKGKDGDKGKGSEKGKGGDGGKGKGGDGGKGGYAGNDVKDPFFAPPLYQQPPLEAKYMGEWKIHNPNVGVSAMQFQLMPNNKAVWFDTTNLGPSALELGPKGNCPPNPDTNNEPDCYAHAVTYDVESGTVVPVYIRTDPWCSSGHLMPNGDLMSTGGNKMGFKSIRILKADDPAPKFVERENALGANRWYPSNCNLEDGNAVVVGGRDAFSYDLVPPQIDGKVQTFDFPFLQQTTDPPVVQGLYVENNLYPFIFLLPDGNVFIFANDRAIAFDPKTGKTVKEYPQLAGGARNYPASGMSALLPLRLSPKGDQPLSVEVVVCGGNSHDAINQVDKRYTQNRVFTPANADCNRIKVMSDKPVWDKEQDMPSPRTMGDLLILPNSQLLLINGAKKGCSGWEDGEDPNLTPTLYMPENEMGKRFKELTPTTIPRMYHSVSSVLPDGQILVAGSNAHQFYTFDGPYYPTDLRVEKFSPHYLDPALAKNRPEINPKGTDVVLKYGKPFKVVFTVPSNTNLGYGDVVVTMLYPPFTTHGFSQNQRMLIVGVEAVDKNTVSAVAPLSGKIAPPGYYLLFVNNRGVPSKGVWVHLD